MDAFQSGMSDLLQSTDEAAVLDVRFYSGDIRPLNCKRVFVSFLYLRTRFNSVFEFCIEEMS